MAKLSTIADLTRVPVKRCVKCNATGVTINRHHKGNDRVLSRYSIKILTEYALFKDCVNLCDNCHAEIHCIYFLYVDWTIKPIKKLRRAFIDICNEWLTGNAKYGSITPEVIFYHKVVQTKLANLHNTYKDGTSPNVFNDTENKIGR